ncbi:MAG TPA: hypothetical protein VFO65_10040, partial [Acidimicrobiales bacterium]|nr:hypothetical protein [Acidimicrobiales bacterium]
MTATTAAPTTGRARGPRGQPQGGDGRADRLDRRFEAVVLQSDLAEGDGAPEALDALREAGVAVGLVAGAATGLAGAGDPWLGDAVRRECARLWTEGIGPAGVLVVVGGPGLDAEELAWLPGHDLATATVACVDVPLRRCPPEVVELQGGTPALRALLRDQAERRRAGDVPAAVAEPGWALAVEGYDPARTRVVETLLTLADGRIGYGGAPLVAAEGAEHWVLAGNLYVGAGPATHLVSAPTPFLLAGRLPDGARITRLLDLRSGLLYEDVEGGGLSARSVRLASLARPGTAVVRARWTGAAWPPGPPLAPPEDDPVLDAGEEGDVVWMRVAAGPGGIVTAARQHHRVDGGAQ